MDSVSDQSPAPAISPWDRLPSIIQETILSLLPISTLILCKSVSRSLRSTIQSPAFTSFYPHQPRRRDQDLLFLLFTDDSSPALVAAYHPSRDTWLPLSLPPDLISVPASGGSLIAIELPNGRASIFNLFTGVHRSKNLPYMVPLFKPYVLALIQETPSDYKIVGVSNADSIVSQVFDSRSGRWEIRGRFAGRFAVLASAAYLDGLLYCLSRGPDHILTFDPIGGEWSLVVEVMPASSIVCPHIMVFRGGLFLLSGVEDVGVIVRVGIWELDQKEKKWRAICFMPDELFSEFRAGNLEYFEAADRAGKICLYNKVGTLVFMYDLDVRRWRRLPPCYIPKNRRSWFGHALEPHIDLVK